MKTMKPILGKHEVKILEAYKNAGATDSKFVITLKMETVDAKRSLVDNLFYDEENTSRLSVVPAVLSALAEQTGLARSEFIKEEGDELTWDVDKILKHIVGKVVVLYREAITLERNGQTYYNINYRDVEKTEDAVQL